MFIEEAGTAEVQHAVQGAEAVTAAELTYVEAHSALARMRAGKRLSTSAYRAKAREFDSFWGGVAAVEISSELLRTAAALAARHTLRAYDAVQLAAALIVREAEDFVFACWDDELTAAAQTEGFNALVP